MENRLDFNDFAGNFGLWAEMFRPFIESEAMYNIYQTLKSEKGVITPTAENTFRCFQRTNPDKVKSIWYLMDPYPRRYKDKTLQATGIALDCSNSPDGKIQPSLEVFFKGIEAEIGGKIKRTGDLSYLTEQGVMLLNTDFTCRVGRTASHKKLWEPFQKFFLEEIMGSRAGIVYVLSGEESKRMEKYINPLGNFIFKIEHPMAAEHRHTEWETDKVFKKINWLLKERKMEEIQWDAGKIVVEEAPF